MNSNLVHNILNVAGWILGGITAILMYLGCTTNISGALDCTTSTIIPASWFPVIIIITTVMAFTKSIMNVMRDGFSGLFKVQPPVADDVKTVNVIAPATPEGKAVVADVKVATVKK